MALPGEFEYYSTRSGLPAGTLADHRGAFYRGQLAVSSGTLSGLEFDYYASKGFAGGALDDRRLAYFASLSGLPAGTVDDHMKAFFLNPPPVGPVETRRNLFLNPAGAGAKAWSSTGNYAVTADGTQAAGGPVAGARWQKYTLTEAAAGTQVIQLAPSGLLAMPVLPNTQYIVSGYALFSAGTITNIGLYQLEEYNAAGTLTSAPFLTTSVVPAAGAWGRDSKLITTAADTAFIRPKMRFAGLNAAIGAYVGVGAVLAELGSSLGSYFDGGFADGGGNDYQWVAAADDSPSIIMA